MKIFKAELSKKWCRKHAIPTLYGEIPYNTEQGNFRGLLGTVFIKQGNSVPATLDFPDVDFWYCQSNRTGLCLGHDQAQRHRSSCCKILPLGACGRAAGLVGLSVDEMAFVVEVVLDVGMDRGELLQGLHPAEFEHCPFSSSEG